MADLLKEVQEWREHQMSPYPTPDTPEADAFDATTWELGDALALRCEELARERDALRFQNETAQMAVEDLLAERDAAQKALDTMMAPARLDEREWSGDAVTAWRAFHIVAEERDTARRIAARLRRWTKRTDIFPWEPVDSISQEEKEG